MHVCVIYEFTFHLGITIFIISIALSVHICIFYQVYVSLRNKSIFRLHPWLTVHMSLLKYCSERENVIHFLLFPPFLKILCLSFLRESSLAHHSTHQTRPCITLLFRPG